MSSDRIETLLASVFGKVVCFEAPGYIVTAVAAVIAAMPAGK